MSTVIIENATPGGPKPQEHWDFNVTKELIEVIDPNSPLLDRLQGWANVLAMAISTGQRPELDPADEEELGETAARVIAIVARSNHPVMLKRFQGYVKMTLSDEGFQKVVVAQQIAYDFGQIADYAIEYGFDITAEIERYRDLILSVEQLQPGETFSNDWYALVGRMATELGHRPLFLNRVYIHQDSILPASAPPPATTSAAPVAPAPTDEDEDGPGGLPASLLNGSPSAP